MSPGPGFLARSLRSKITLGVMLPLVLLLGAFTAIEYRRHRSAVLSELSLLAAQAGMVIESNLRHEMLEVDREGVNELLNTITKSEEFRVVYLLDPSGRVTFAPNNEGKGMLLDYRQPGCQPCHGLPPEQRPASVVVEAEDGERVFRSMLPISNSPACHKCHDPEQRLLGLLLTDIRTTPLEDWLAASLQEKLLWMAGTILVTVIIVNLALSRLVINRLERIAKSLARFGRGQRNLKLQADSPDAIGRLTQAFNDMGQNIQSEEARTRVLSADVRRHAARQRELLKRLIRAQEEERQRLAHDLHDDLGQDLAGLAVGIAGAERLIANSPERVGIYLRQIRGQISEMTDRAYDMILNLRPSALDDLGLVAALRAHAERVLGGAGIKFEIEERYLARRLPSEIETALFRAIQEALSNVVRHAGASRVRVSLSTRDGRFEGEVDDDGRGFDPETISADGSSPRGLGLLGMQERVALCGGMLEFFSRPGAGTRIRIQIPLPEVSSG
jgi:two-component system sensor histidine kinase UhpB